MWTKISNNAFDDTDVQEIILSVELKQNSIILIGLN